MNDIIMASLPIFHIFSSHYCSHYFCSHITTFLQQKCPNFGPRSRLRRMAVKSVTGQHINDSFNSSRCLSENPLELMRIPWSWWESLGADGNPLKLMGISQGKRKILDPKSVLGRDRLAPRRHEHQLEMSTPTLIKKKAGHTILLHTTHKLLHYLVIH